MTKLQNAFFKKQLNSKNSPNRYFSKKFIYIDSIFVIMSVNIKVSALKRKCLACTNTIDKCTLSVICHILRI